MRKCLISVNVALPLSFALFHFPPLWLFVSVVVLFVSFHLRVADPRSAVDLPLFRVCCRLRAHVKHHKQKAAMCICKHEWIHLRKQAQYSSIIRYDCGSCVTLRAVCLLKKERKKKITFWTFLHMLHQNALEWTSAPALLVCNQWKHANVP